MAATLDANLGTKAQSASTTCSLVTSSAAAAGTLIVIGVGYFATSGSGVTVSITTAAGLTWGTSTRTNSGSINSYLFWAYAASGLASSSTITWTTSVGNADWLIGAASFLGMETTPTLLAQNGAAASAAPWSSGSIVAGEVNLGVVTAFSDGGGAGTASSTSDAPLTELIDLANAGQNEVVTLAYDLASASTATLQGDWSTSLSHTARGGAFEIAPSGAVPVGNRLRRWRY